MVRNLGVPILRLYAIGAYLLYPANFVCDGVFRFQVVRPSVKLCFFIVVENADRYSSMSAHTHTQMLIRCTYKRKRKS